MTARTTTAHARAHAAAMAVWHKSSLLACERVAMMPSRGGSPFTCTMGVCASTACVPTPLQWQRRHTVTAAAWPCTCDRLPRWPSESVHRRHVGLLRCLPPRSHIQPVSHHGAVHAPRRDSRDTELQSARCVYCGGGMRVLCMVLQGPSQLTTLRTPKILVHAPAPGAVHVPRVSQHRICMRFSASARCPAAVH